jgi:hypothetical protein
MSTTLLIHLRIFEDYLGGVHAIPSGIQDDRHLTRKFEFSIRVN